VHNIPATVFSQRDWLYLGLILLAFILITNALHFAVFRFLGNRVNTGRWQGLGIRRYLAKPARAVLSIIGLLVALPFVPRFPPFLLDRISQTAEIILVLCLGWLALGGVYVAQAAFLGRFDTSVADNLRARRVHTQMQFVRRMVIALLVLVDAAALLWSLHDPSLWKYGTGLLASAGLASLVLATAARSTASNLLAGMQIAFTEPIRIDDVVVIAGEWGRISEITSTYVVVKIWDQRTLIVPLSFFIEQPFANWTRTGSEIMGTAFLYVDYSVPVEPLRAELQRVADASPLWDKRVCGLQVTNLTAQTMELRCLISSIDSGKNFDLRCLVREKMIGFIRENYPSALPTLRIQDMRSFGPNGTDGQSLSSQAQALPGQPDPYRALVSSPKDSAPPT